MAQKIEPCVDCGLPAIVKRHERGNFYVECIECGCHLDVRADMTKDAAIASWNKFEMPRRNRAKRIAEQKARRGVNILQGPGQFGEWIPTSRYFPILNTAGDGDTFESARVLVYIPAEARLMGQFGPDDGDFEVARLYTSEAGETTWEWGEDYSRCDPHTVSHWMALPEIPE